MDYTDSDDVREFRAELRGWLRENRDSFGRDGQPAADSAVATLEWYRTLAAARYTTAADRPHRARARRLRQPGAQAPLPARTAELH